MMVTCFDEYRINTVDMRLFILRFSSVWVLMPTLLLTALVFNFYCCLVAKDVNIFFDELEGVTSPSKDDDSLLHHGNLTSTSDDTSRLEAVGEVRTLHA